MWQYQYKKQDVHKFNMQSLNIIKRYCKGMDSLELGGGTGQLSYLLKADNVVGQINVVDSSPSAIRFMLDYYQDMNLQDFEYRLFLCDIFHIGGQYKNTFDIVLSSGLIEHFKGARLREICQIHKLFSCGFVVIIVPADNEKARIFAESDECKNKYGYEKPMSEKDLDDLFVDHEFKKIHSERFYKDKKLLIGIYRRI
jgi:2-polyprenyl-3-methyl-5-hydroxy-6-metoxy-1,4-benzoquinol methylase